MKRKTVKKVQVEILEVLLYVDIRWKFFLSTLETFES